MKQGQLEFIDTAIKCNNIAHKRMFGTDSDGTGYDQTDAIVEETKKELVANGITGCYDKEILDYLKSENWNTLVEALNELTSIDEK